MMKREYAVCNVGLKILLYKGGKVLMLRSDDGNFFDLPGGRIDNVEHHTPLRKILAREVREELGDKIKYELGGPIFQYRRYYDDMRYIPYILHTVYKAKYLSGDIKLSFEHSDYMWVNPRTFRLSPKEFSSKEELQAFKNYFQSIT